MLWNTNPVSRHLQCEITLYSRCIVLLLLLLLLLLLSLLLNQIKTCYSWFVFAVFTFDLQKNKLVPFELMTEQQQHLFVLAWLVDRNVIHRCMTEQYAIQEADVKLTRQVSLWRAKRSKCLWSSNISQKMHGYLRSRQRTCEWRMNGTAMFVQENLNHGRLRAIGACFGFITIVQALALNPEPNSGIVFSVDLQR